MIPETGFYRHYKGDVYFAFGVSEHTETKEKLVLYKRLGKVWARPIDNFNGLSETGVKRFTKISNEEGWASR